jgi:hypothetical protein
MDMMSALCLSHLHFIKLRRDANCTTLPINTASVEQINAEEMRNDCLVAVCGC